MGSSHYFLGVLLALWIMLSVAENETFPDPLCNVTSAENVQYAYKTEVVTSEYIVSFKGYYKKVTRAKYITAALYNAGVYYWTIVDRDNPAAKYPSDFDVVLLDDKLRIALDALNDHPAVKKVSPQKRITRSVKNVKELQKNNCGQSSTRKKGGKIKMATLQTLREF